MIEKEHSNLVSIKRACELCKVSRSGYYDWHRKPAKTDVDVLCQKIKRIFKRSRKTYGTRRIKKQLAVEGIVASRQRIRRKMAEQGLVAKAHRKTRAITNSNHDHQVAPNLLDRQFDVQHPNRAWVMDITYLATSEGWLYLAIVLDLYSRMVVGWSIGMRMTKELVINALETAIRRRNPGPGLICHSDRGSQYCSHAYQDLLREHGFLCSMSRKGECQDNACAETFFHSLKVEWIYGEPLKSRYRMKQEVREYIEVFYNRQRLHSNNGYLSPCDFERVSQSSFLLSA
ncbi:IS2 transposase TnpB [Sporotomaculum syntrophicum]|uniref:IS2 transposase TnpB n=2 Tax=Sporotomaculum syntrophicum TaxID=182264 RepID=A0A9D3AVM7_9FIRM|nr:IS2 transposase TnpB [Sporotomaculum syntrophicum]